MKTSREYRQIAWNQLKTDYWNPFLVCVIYTAIVGLVSAIPGFGSIISLLITGSASVILVTYLANFLAGKKPDIGSIFKEPQKNFVNRMVGGLLTMLFTFLWTLLFIIPGIIKSYSYKLTSYIQTKGDVPGNDAITLSTKMMYGHKWELFCLQLSFIGWFLLCCLTFGIGFVFLSPYVQSAQVAFYNDVYNEYVSIHPDEAIKEENSANAEDAREVVVE